jgi:DNA-binding MarR family transcriptional regulator/N-acetylglutamate synthase-like GNAT family acetyltransferase
MTNPPPSHVAAVRRFNRLYTRELGLLGGHHLDSPYGLTEIRVLWELAHRAAPTASELADDLGIDRGQLSRLLAKLTKEGLVKRTPNADDKRRGHLELTPEGKQTFAELNTRADQNVEAVLAALPSRTRHALVQAATALTGAPEPQPEVILRDPRPGDFGWIIHRHGVLYALERGWDERFEGFVAEVIAKYAIHHDPAKEKYWVAERGGQIVGSVYVVENAPGVAQLRCLLVEPSARGLGLGQRLVRECIALARSAGYKTMILWTHDVLVSAQRIYAAEGFKLIEEKPHTEFGEGLVGQTWELKL